MLNAMIITNNNIWRGVHRTLCSGMQVVYTRLNVYRGNILWDISICRGMQEIRC